MAGKSKRSVGERALRTVGAASMLPVATMRDAIGEPGADRDARFLREQVTSLGAAGDTDGPPVELSPAAKKRLRDDSGKVVFSREW